jgi:MFS family permease
MAAETLQRRITTIRQVLGADGKGWILLTVSGGWLLTLGVRIVYPALLPDIIGEFGVGYTGGGFLLSALWVAYALMQFPGGVAADLVGEKRVILGSVGTVLAAILAVVGAPTYGVFVASTVLLGLGAGLYGTSRVTIVTDVFPENKTTAVSFTQAAGNVGTAVLPVLAGGIAVAFGWRLGFGYLVPLFVLVIVGIVAFVPRRTSAEPDAGEGLNRAFLEDLRGAVLNRNVLLITLLQLSLMTYYQGITGFLPTYLIDVKGLSQTLASTVFGAFFVTAIGMQFVSGLVADRYGQRRTIVLFVLIAFPAAVALPVLDSQPAVIGATLLAAGVLGAFPPSHTYAVDLIPDALQGSGYGMIRTLYIGAAAGAPPVVGWLADGGRFDLAITLLGTTTLLVVGLCVILPDLRAER